jgi:hypothetical protein
VTQPTSSICFTPIPLPAPLELGLLSSWPFTGELCAVLSPRSTLLLLAFALSPFRSLNLSCSRLGREEPRDGFCGRFTEELLLLDVGVILVWLDALEPGRGGSGRDALLKPWLLSSISAPGGW